ncbi:heme exporter protein CcmD [Glaciecola sp. MH2013]|uniref:heme exporter protein CcmD n=1 Tax=Glaciecola sp. MH2013 TaxID=2785524 RepID=UPI0018A06E4C|nr:heme exporter protein CcmD [Glaciecola sp. MH2013]MBF7072207.1 heme exporter protein CcmD [Glaciecola sp. MH2013]
MEFQFETMADFFDMGGYALFVWLSFACTFICMLALFIQSVFVSKKIQQGVKKEAARAQRIIDARVARSEKMRLKRETQDSEISRVEAAPTNSNSNDEVSHEPKT